MTVAELRKAIESIDGELPVYVNLRVEKFSDPDAAYVDKAEVWPESPIGRACFVLTQGKIFNW